MTIFRTPVPQGRKPLLVGNGGTGANNAANARINLGITEGTWTPVLSFGGATTGITYLTVGGVYQKIGNWVHCTGGMVLTSNGSATGDAVISGLPFSSNATTGASVAAIYVDGVTGISGGVMAVLNVNSDDMLLYEGVTGDSTPLTEADITDNFVCVLSICYQAASV